MFDQKYLDTYLPDLTPERTKKEVDFIIKSAKLRPAEKILDLACGHGRHSIELSSRGFSRITGLDYSTIFIQKARADADKAKVAVEFLEGDMRNLPFTEKYDVVLSLFTSFGYFEDKQNQAVLGQMAKVLKLGGRLLLDVMSAEAVINRFVSEGIKDEATGKLKISREASMGGRTVNETEIFDTDKQVIHNHREWLQGTKKEEYDYWLHVYTKEQYQKMLHNAGFHINSLTSEEDYKNKPKNAPQKQRIIILAKKAGR